MTPTAPDVTAGLLVVAMVLVAGWGLLRPPLRSCVRCGRLADPRGVCLYCGEVQE